MKVLQPLIGVLAFVSVQTVALGAIQHVEFTKILRLTGNQSSACYATVNANTLDAHMSYDYDTHTGMGIGHALIEELNSSSELYATMGQLGFSDKLAFAHYFRPYASFILNKKQIHIYAVVMDICPDNTQEVLVKFLLNKEGKSDKACYLTSEIWDNCRH